jgi:hypothetical protein
MAILPIPLFAGLLLAASPDEAWVKIQAFQDKDVEVRLLHRPKASLATPDWLAIEIENRTGKTLSFSNGGYQIEMNVGDLRTGKGLLSGRLSSGSSRELLGEAEKVLPLKFHRNLRHAGDSGAASLGLPPPTGWRVRANFSISLRLADGREVSTPKGGIPFTFEWHHPGDDGFAAMRTRLRQLLREPGNDPAYLSILEAHLAIPEVAGMLTPDDVLGALRGRDGCWDGRWALLRYLGAHHGSEPGLIAYYLRKLKDRDEEVIGDLLESCIWDSSFTEVILDLYKKDPPLRLLDMHWERSFVPMLVDLFEANYDEHKDVLESLHDHRSDWVDDNEIVARLSRVVRLKCPLVGEDVWRLRGKDREEWGEQVKVWSLTGDRSVIETLRPVLHDRRRVRAWSDEPVGFNAPWVEVRVCDYALEGILTVLDGKEKANQALFRDLERKNFRPRHEAPVMAARDRMIVDLEKRLIKESRKGK